MRLPLQDFNFQFKKWNFDSNDAIRSRLVKTIPKLWVEHAVYFYCNCFSFADNHYKQINGVALGTKMGSSYVIIFVG